MAVIHLQADPAELRGAIEELDYFLASEGAASDLANRRVVEAGGTSFLASARVDATSRSGAIYLIPIVPSRVFRDLLSELHAKFPFDFIVDLRSGVE